ncbi:MAG: RsmD family RNA methyltransferase [Caldilinea sp.]
MTCHCPVTLSHYAATTLLVAARGNTAAALISVDLNRTLIEVALSADGVTVADGVQLTWSQLEEIADDDAGCYGCTAEGIHKIQIFSEETQRVYTLFPTTGAPTMLISGIPMHRIKETDPHRDTLSKIRALGRIRGCVLDTCTGLGYTALEAARYADQVTTIELDPAVHEIIRQNPWSCALFETPNITPLIGDSFEMLEEFDDETFDCIIHDPPMFSLAGDLYSLTFYRQLHGVLRRGGRLFHYIGNPESRSGATVTRGVVRRLGEAGFHRIQGRPQAFGVVAIK